jgi:Ca2+-binding EF-hand superfamily protein
VIPRLTLFAVAVACVCAAWADAAEPAPAPTAKAEPFDVLYLSEARPVAVRLQITTDGKPLGEAWGRFADALFARLDADKGGSLDEKELTKLRPMLALLAGRNVPAAAATTRLPMTRDDLAAYLRQNDLGPLRLPRVANNSPQFSRTTFRRGGAPTPETLDKAFMELLDANTDGKLSPAELTAGIEILGKLDIDENEMVGVDELLRRPLSPFFVEDFDGRMVGPAAPGVELLSFGRKADANLARRLLARYGPKPANAPAPNVKGPRPVPIPAAVESTARRLTPKDLKIGAEMFEALDQDGDGELDAEELARFGQSTTPEVEIAFRLGTRPAGRTPAEVVTVGKSSLKTSVGERGTDVALEVPGVRLELIPAATSAEVARTAFRSRYLNRFRAIDRDANGYLDTTETNNDPVFRDLFALFDANRDGKVFEKELTAALDDLDTLAADAASGIVTVEVAEAGRGLFGLIDADGDGRMSVRELRAIPKLLERFDSDKDGALAPGEVPRRFQATLSRGLTTAGPAPPRVVSFRPDGMMGMPRPPVGPLWFQKMDRNRDNDVSRREFLGADEDFRKLDADGDGLLSPQEAEAAGKK